MTTNATVPGEHAILYVDDEEQALKYFRKEFKHEYPILTAPGAAQALAVLEKEHAKVGVLITDHRMSGPTGVELLSRVRQTWPNIVRILVTAYSDMASAVEAVNSGAVYKYLTKPVDPVYLGQMLREAMNVFTERHRKDVLLEEKMSVLHQMMVADRVKGMAALASGISHHVRNSMTAMTCYFEELDTAGQAPPADYLAELRGLAKQEREQLARLLQSVTKHVALPRMNIVDEVDVNELVRRAAAAAAPGANGKGFAVDAAAGTATLRVDGEAVVGMLKALLEHVALHAPAEGQVHVTVEAPVAHWNTQGARVLIRGGGPGWTDDEVTSFFTPFAVSPTTPADLEIGLLDTFHIAHGHGGDVIAHKASPLGPGFELRLPLDPGAVRRPVLDEGFVASARH